MNRYIMYCRKSTDEDSRQVQSLATQERMNNEVIEKDRLVLVGKYFESRSAKIADNRPFFSEMIKRIKNGEANAILVQHPDRLARNLEEAGILINLVDTGILTEIRTPNTTYSTPSHMIQIIDEFARATNYSRILSIKVKEGFQSKILKGVFPHQAPLGYLNIDSQIVIDNDREKLIQLMFSLVENDYYSTRQVTKIMEEYGLRSRKNKKLSKSRIHAMLINPFYYGEMLIKGKIYQGTHLPIISRKTFNNVQEILHGKHRPRPKKRFFLYRNYLSCGNCFCKLTATIKKGRYNYYYCTNGKGVCEQHQHYLREKDITEALDTVFEPFQYDKEVLELSFDLYAQSIKERQSENQISINGLEARIHELEQNEATLTDKLIQSIVSDEVYKATSERIKTEKENIYKTIQTKKNPTNPKVTLELLEKVKSVAVPGYEIHKNGDLESKIFLLKSALWNCMITDGKATNIRYKEPFNLLVKYSKNDDFVKMRG